jgi:hypothetical protein
MKRILGLVVAGGLWLGLTSAADAQFALSVGNPYAGGFAIGAPYAGVYGGGFYGAPSASYGVVPRATIYSSGYAGVYPGVTTYSSGYYGAPVAPVAPVLPAVAYPGYGYRPFYGVAAYPRVGYYGGFRRFGYGGFGRRGWGYW